MRQANITFLKVSKYISLSSKIGSGGPVGDVAFGGYQVGADLGQGLLGGGSPFVKCIWLIDTVSGNFEIINCEDM